MAVCSSANAGHIGGHTPNLDFQITFEYGGTSVTVVDNSGDGFLSGDLGVGSHTTDNTITFDVTINGLQFQGSAATTNSPGVDGIANLKLQSSLTYVGPDASFVSGQIAYVYLSSLGFNTPTTPPAVSATTDGTVNNNLTGAGSGVAVDYWVKSYFDQTDLVSTDPSGSSPAASNPAIIQIVGNNGLVGLNTVAGPTSDAPFAGPATVVMPGALNADYTLNLESLTTIYTSTFDTTVTADLNLSNIPEPATMTIWACLSGVGMVVAARKRRKQNVA
ncbi:MAG: hypothetical protein COA78_29405 [Blastopirellula sp.]|nr:MAG: hypothetical protein COA78_29405 [Blastopirellula sp.]